MPELTDHSLTTATLSPFDGEIILELEQDGTDRHAKIYLTPRWRRNSPCGLSSTRLW